MTRDPVSNLAAVQGSAIEVRQEGRLVAKVQSASADALLQRGWAMVRGAGTKKYLELTPGAPWTPLSGGVRGGSRTTERIRNDQGIIISPRGGSGLQHKTLPRDL